MPDIKSFPLDRTRRFTRDVVSDPIDTTYFVDDAVGCPVFTDLAKGSALLRPVLDRSNTMSCVRVRSNGRYQARVTYEGREFTKTFTNRADAVRFARQTRVNLERGIIEQLRPAATLHDVLTQYIAQVLPTKRGKSQELCILKAWQRRPVAGMKIGEVKPVDVAAARDARLLEVSTGSARRELDALSAVFTWALKEQQLCDSNPVHAIRKPPQGRPRTRRLFPGEIERVITAGKGSPDFAALVTLALESAMRRSEILGMEWQHVDLKRRLIHLPLTKNGTSRDVPLSPRALAVLEALPRRAAGKVFNKNPTSLSSAFQRAVARARINYLRECESQGIQPDDKYLVDLRLHTLRHEATTRLLERGFSVVATSQITGHLGLQMLARYSHLRTEDLADQLAA